MDSQVKRASDLVVGQFEFVLKGRGFSRAVRCAKSIAALATEGMRFSNRPTTSDFTLAPSQSDAPVDLERCRTRARNIAQKWREAICGRIAGERFLQSLACTPRQVRRARPKAVDSSRNSASPDAASLPGSACKALQK